MKIMGSSVRGLSKGLFDSYVYYYFDGTITYRRQNYQHAVELIRQIKRKI